jgi:NAD(P)-dependent dehydrogenase (short-subunit alcohol dehydrogenase family)
MDRSFAGRIALVTGASRGIGRALALALGAAGAHVVAVARTVGALEELDDAIRAAGGEPPTLVPLDLKDMPAIDRLGAALYERFGRLDALVGNAGLLGTLSPLTHIEPKVFDEVMTVNVTANWRLIRSLDPLLRRSDAGRAVFLSSSAAHKNRPFWGLYATSKAALEHMVLTYAAESEHTQVRVTVVDPGPLRTAMRRQAMPGEDPTTLRTPDELAPQVLRFLAPSWTGNGLLYDFRAERLLRVVPPVPVEG